MILSTFGLCVKDVGLFSEMAKGNDWQTMCGSLLSLLFNPAVTVLSLLDSHVWIRTDQQTLHLLFTKIRGLLHQQLDFILVDFCRFGLNKFT